VNANASWQRLAGERSDTLVGFGLLALEGALSFVVVGPAVGQALADRVHRQLRAHAVHAGPPARAVKLPACNVELPFTNELALAAHEEKLVLAIGQNFDQPGFAGGFAGAGWAGVQGAPRLVPVALAPAQRAVVSFASARAWSTWTFPCEEWLFDPRIHEALGALALTFGTADGQTALFRYDPSSAALRALGVVPLAVNAVLLPGSQGLHVFHRTPDPSWSGYADSQYAWTRGPVALPLRVTAAGPGGSVGAPTRVAGIGDEPVYAFDATFADDGSLLLALVRGPPKWPSVTVVRVAPGGGTSALPALELDASPVAVRLRPTARGVAVATFTREGFKRRADLYHCDHPFQ
jgi:hypothetical protein